MTSALVTSVLQLVVGEQPSPGLVEAVTSLVDTTVRPHPAPCTLHNTDVMVTLYPLQVSSARQLSWLPATGSISPAMGIFSALLTLAVAPFAGQILLSF